MSELKNVTGETKLPYGALANGADGIKDSITNFTDARKSDIDNEHLPPDLIDPEDFISSGGSFEEHDSFDSSTAPSSPEARSASPNGSTEMKEVFGMPGCPGGSGGDQSPIADNASARFRKGHGRQSSLGTTRTSPSTRRRSLENTMVMMREAMSKSDSSMGELFVPARFSSRADPCSFD